MVKPKDLVYYQAVRLAEEQQGLNPVWLFEKLEENGEKRWFMGSVNREETMVRMTEDGREASGNGERQ